MELLIDTFRPPDNAPFLCMGRITDAVLNTRLWMSVFCGINPLFMVR